MLKRLLPFLLMLGLVGPASAQITIPNTLVTGATILASGLNANFSALGTNALNRGGGTMTGTLTVQAIAAATGSTYDIGTSGTKFNSLYLAAGLTAATGTFSGAITAASGAFSGAVSGLTGTFTTVPIQVYTETKTVITPAASPAIDLSLGTHFTYSNTTTPTFSFTNPPASGKAGAFTLAITGNGSAHAPVWPASVKWPGGTAPTVTVTNGQTDFFTFITYDGGTTWYGFTGGQNF